MYSKITLSFQLTCEIARGCHVLKTGLTCGHTFLMTKFPLPNLFLPDLIFHAKIIEPTLLCKLHNHIKLSNLLAKLLE